jgi:hypothetical protein
MPHNMKTTLWIRGQASSGAFKKFKKGEMWRVEYISTAVSNKLETEVWRSPSRRGEQAQLCPRNCRLELAQTQWQKWARCSTAVFPKMFMLREKQSQVPPPPKNYNVKPPPLRTVAPPHFATVYNKLTRDGGGCCVSPSECPSYLAPALCMFRLLLFVLSASPVTPS